MSAPTERLDLDALEKLLTRATEAPWRVVLDDSENATTVWQVCTSPDHPADDDPDHIVVYDCCADGGLHGSPFYTEADAELVAAARNALPGLIRTAREAERLRAEPSEVETLATELAEERTAHQQTLAELERLRELERVAREWRAGRVDRSLGGVAYHRRCVALDVAVDALDADTPVEPARIAKHGCDDCSVEPGESHRYAGCPGNTASGGDPR